MLSLYELKHHCRTCFMKLETAADGEESKKYVQICKYPLVQELMRVCVTGGQALVAGHTDELESHMPNLCGLCLEKWQDFVSHYQLAIKSVEKLRKILEKESTANKCTEANKVYLENDTPNDFCEIEKYDTASPFFRTRQEDTPSPNIENKDEFDTFLSTINTPKCDSSSDDESSLCAEIKHEESSESAYNVQPSKQDKKVRTRITRDKTKRKCNKKKSKVVKLSAHENDFGENQSKRKVYRCEPCKKYFYEILTYEGHMKRVHEGIKRAYQCKECDKAYSLYKNLVGHIAERHSAESQEIHKCEECNKTYKTKTTLKKHMKLQHSTSNEEDAAFKSKRVICDQCGFLAAHQDSLTQHIKNKHTETEEVRCEQCPKVFKSQYNLKYHIQSFHTKVVPKPFKCNECSMAFTRRPLLNIHIRSHLNYSERMKCDFEGCEVRFIKLSSKRRHMRLVHLKVKQHVCDICGEAFGIKATLRHHRYIHTGEKPYKCNVCGQGFRQATAMKTHRKTHFNKDTTTAPAIADTSIAKAKDIGLLTPECSANLENTLRL